MKHKKRYSLLKVALVVLGINIIFTILGILVILFVPGANKEVQLKDLYTTAAIVRTVLSMVFYSLFYYFGLNAYHQILRSRKKAGAHIQFAFILVAIAIANHYLNMAFASKEQLAKSHKYGWQLSLFSFAVTSIFTAGICMLIAYIDNLRIEKKERKQLEQKSLQLETKNTQANYNFLKAQINPHFLHNTLNFFYAKSLPYSTELSEGILTLSEIMRYSLTNVEDVEGKVPLADEIEHVRNVIKINQMRFSDKLKLNFEVSGIVEGLRIIPFVLITIVENALKHGELKDANDPTIISLAVKPGAIHFYCHNKKKTGPKELSTGLGLDNTRKRLDLAYGNNYTLDVKETTTYYTTELTIHQL